MTHYWNDPPESAELPECCDEYMDFNPSTGICKCSKCGTTIEPQEDIDASAFTDIGKDWIS